MLVALTGGQLTVTATFSIVARRYPRMAPWGQLALGMGTAGLGLLAMLPLLSGTVPATTLTLAVALLGLALSGAALGLSMQAYTLLGITTAPKAHVGSATATLTFTRQLGGSLGAATLGWLVNVLPTASTALPIALATAAAVLIAALAIAPRTVDEPVTR